MRELHRLPALEELCRKWELIAQEGFCTMNAPLSCWVQTRAQVDDNSTHKHFLGLKTMARMMPIPNCDALIAQHHNAGADAHITCLIYATLLAIVERSGGFQVGLEHDVVMTAAPAAANMPDVTVDEEDI
jgi:hypothetical protein